MSGWRRWAPRAERLEIEIDGVRHDMAAEPGGWWTLAEPAPHDGATYALFVDGEGPLPDPLSRSQPQGVHGPSRWVDHGSFPWTDQGWQAPPLASAVVYEMHVGTFTPEGSFEAAIGRLDHLVDLGVTHLELMPVAEFPGDRGWGYDGVDLGAPHHAYGGPTGLKRLVDACHGRGLAVLLDVVYNHLGPDGNYLTRFGPYFTDRYATPWGEAVNLDRAGSDEVRRHFLDNALMWLRDYHVDGLRIDAVHAIVDTSAVHFLEQLAVEVETLGAHLGRRFVLIAESDLNDPRVVRPREVGGYGLDAQWNEDFHHALHALLTGERGAYYQDFGALEDLARALTAAFHLDGRYSSYRRRRHGRPARDLSGHRFLGCLQNHDQIGNRALGERLGHLVSPGLLRIGAAVMLTAPFAPLLFQGEEWGASTPFLYFTDHRDPALAEAVTRGRRKELSAFGFRPEEIPDPQAAETSGRCRLRWEERLAEPHRSHLEWYRELIAIRRRYPELTDGRLDRVRVDLDETTRRLVVRRGRIAVCCNLADRPASYTLAGAQPRQLLLASSPEIVLNSGALTLPPESVAVLG